MRGKNSGADLKGEKLEGTITIDGAQGSNVVNFDGGKFNLLKIIKVLKSQEGSSTKTAEFESSKSICKDVCNLLEKEEAICDGGGNCRTESDCKGGEDCICSLTLKCKNVEKSEGDLKRKKSGKDLKGENIEGTITIDGAQGNNVVNFEDGKFDIFKIIKVLKSQESSSAKTAEFESSKSICKDVCNLLEKEEAICDGGANCRTESACKGGEDCVCSLTLKCKEEQNGRNEGPGNHKSLKIFMSMT